MRYRWCALILLASLVWAQAPPAAVLAVQGDIATPLSLTADDLAKMPRETASVPAPDGSKIVYEGVTLRAVLKKAGAPFGKQLRGKVLTTYVLAKAKDGYQVSSRWANWTPISATKPSCWLTSATGSHCPKAGTVPSGLPERSRRRAIGPYAPNAGSGPARQVGLPARGSLRR